MSSKIYFYANIEIDLLIISSIASILKNTSVDTKKELILILPLNKRLGDDRMSEVYGIFDEVIKIPFDDIMAHVIHFPKGLIKLSKFKKNFKKIKLEKNALFFCFDAFTYTDVIVFNEAQKSKCKLIVLSAFVGKRFDKSKLSINWHSTIVYSLYSLLITKPIRFLNCRIQNTTISGYNIFYGKPDYVLKIETSNSILNPKVNLFEKLPFPLPLLKDFNSAETSKNSNLLMLVSSMHGERYKSYWDHVRTIIKNLPENISVFIKDHPQAISKAKEELKAYKLQYITGKENMELLVLKNNISTVLGHGSTGLITASWMGLKVYDYTNILNYQESLNTYYSEYLEMGYGIKRLSNIDEVKNINITTIDVLKNRERVSDRWRNVLTEIQK